MSSSRVTSSVGLLAFAMASALLLQAVLGADLLYHSCSSSNKNYAANSPYEASLNRILSYFSYRAPYTGFALGSLGQTNLDRPYGLTLCRGDVSTSDCRTCILNASIAIRKLCPYDEGAIIWYDNCLLKYSNGDFFGKIDNQNKFSLLNVNNVSDPVTFNQKVQELLGQLAQEASAASNQKMFAAGELEIGGSYNKKLYGLAQCTRDLSGEDCKKCIDGAIGELPGCCGWKEGGRVVGGSCNVRYEIYPFVNA